MKLNPQLDIGDHYLTEAVFMTLYRLIIDLGDNVTGIANIYSTQLLQLRNIICVIKVFNMELLNYTYLFSIPPCPYHAYVG